MGVTLPHNNGEVTKKQLRGNYKKVNKIKKIIQAQNCLCCLSLIYSAIILFLLTSFVKIF